MPKKTLRKRKPTVDRFIDRYYLPKECPYCGNNIIYTDSAEIYGRSFGMIYLCRPCNAYVGVHKGTHYPMGSLANVELRQKRKEAHHYFDQIWFKPSLEDGTKARKRLDAYKWLSKNLGIAREQCHIGYFDINICNEVIKLSKARLKKMGKEIK